MNGIVILLLVVGMVWTFQRDRQWLFRKGNAGAKAIYAAIAAVTLLFFAADCFRWPLPMPTTWLVDRVIPWLQQALKTH